MSSVEHAQPGGNFPDNDPNGPPTAYIYFGYYEDKAGPGLSVRLPPNARAGQPNAAREQEAFLASALDTLTTMLQRFRP